MLVTPLHTRSGNAVGAVVSWLFTRSFRFYLVDPRTHTPPEGALFDGVTLFFQQHLPKNGLLGPSFSTAKAWWPQHFPCWWATFSPALTFTISAEELSGALEVFLFFFFLAPFLHSAAVGSNPSRSLLGAEGEPARLLWVRELEHCAQLRPFVCAVLSGAAPDVAKQGWRNRCLLGAAQHAPPPALPASPAGVT